MSEPTPEFGGCLWPVDPACFSDEWEAYSTEVRDRALALASATLTRLTAGRVGDCPITVRPVVADCTCFVPFGYANTNFYPGMNAAGQWVNNCGRVPPGSNGVALPRPVVRVEEVKVDGTVIPTADYTVHGNLLLWAGAGEAPWPTRQDMTIPLGDPGSFSVTYLRTHPVDAAGAYAAGILAMEYAKACAGNKCRLPSGVTTIVRQGLTIEVNSGAFPGGLTGIREVDAFITLWNPTGRIMQTKVYSPDTWGR